MVITVMTMVMRHRHRHVNHNLHRSRSLWNHLILYLHTFVVQVPKPKCQLIVIYGRLILDIKNICAACCLWKISDGLQMADNGNEAADDADSEIQFVSTKTERLKLSWPITDWSERTSAVKTRRFIYNMKTRRFSCYHTLSCLCPGITSWRRTR